MSKYRLSFTTGGLFAREAQLAVPFFAQFEDWSKVRSALVEDNVLQSRTASSRRIATREVTTRLEELSPEELALFSDATGEERAHLMWVAACRRFALIAEFAEEVVREKLLLMTPELTLDDFDTFVRAKALWHEELDSVTPSTMKKLRQNVFAMLREANILSVDGRIVHILPSPRVAEVLRSSGKQDLRLFPMTDADIERVTR